MSFDMGGPPPLFNFMFVLIPVLIVGFIVFAIVRGLVSWSQNNASPVLTREAVVVSKRTEMWGGSGDSSANTSYYVTFEFADRTRVELPMRGTTFGMLAEGDRGVLTSQGTRYMDFQPLL
jgi:hypothetical protein